jgi:hypothetical protein
MLFQSRWLATAVSLAQRFLLSATMSQYDYKEKHGDFN